MIGLVTLVLSVVLQYGAAGAAYRLRRVTDHRAWYLVFGAMFLMAVGRSISLVRALSGDVAEVDLAAEVVALIVSGVMLVGLRSLRSVFRTIGEAGEELRHREDYFRHLIENSDDMITVLDQHGQLIYESPAAAYILGFRRGRVGKSYYDFVHPDDWDEVAEFFVSSLARTGEMHALVHRVCDAGGGWRTLESTGSTRRGLRGQLIMVVNSRDITAKIEAEAEATRVGRILDHSMNEIYLFDAETLRFQQVNAGARRNLGYSLDELRRMIPADIKPEFTRDAFEALVQQLRDGSQERLVFRTRHRRKDGSEYPVDVHLELMDHERRRVFVAIILDVSEQSRAEEEKRGLEVQLRHAQRVESIGTLAGGIAHDFNNILTPIVGHLDLAARRLSPRGPTMRHLEKAQQAATRARELVHRILVFSREVEQERQPVSLQDVVSESLELLRASIPTTIGIQASLPDEGGQVLGDPTQLHQLVLNLCTNAAHAMRDGPGTLELRVDGEDSDWVTLEVRDEGCGMEEATRERIFEPFYTTKAGRGGSGLGMAVVHGIVTSHGGEIEIDSAPGQGCCVTVRLPRADGAVLAGAESPAAVPRGRGRILFVDDEPAIASLGSEMLRSLGYRVVDVSHPELALERFRAGPNDFDAVVTDLTMPGMTGRELARELLALRPDLPVLLTTGYAEGLTRESVRAEGIRDLLPKPFGCHELAEMLHDALRGKTGKPGKGASTPKPKEAAKSAGGATSAGTRKPARRLKSAKSARTSKSTKAARAAKTTKSTTSTKTPKATKSTKTAEPAAKRGASRAKKAAPRRSPGGPATRRRKTRAAS